MFRRAKGQRALLASLLLGLLMSTTRSLGHRLMAAETAAQNVYDCAPGNECPIDISAAHRFLNLSNIAYCPSSSVSNWSCPACANTVEDFNATWMAESALNVAGYFGVSHTHKMIVVAFRGSTNYRNWVANLNTLTIAYPWATNARVHRGFYSAYVGSFKDKVSVGVSELHKVYSNYSIYVTGHSLGAALAILCAADLVVVGKLPVAGVYTFGGPRVGNLAFSQWYNQNIAPEVFRFTHRHDIVPHVPVFGRHLMKFHHVSREIWQPSNDPDIIATCDDSGEDQWCADSVRLALSVEDHLNYLGVRMGSHYCIGPRINENDPELVQLLRDEDDSAALAGEDHITINGLTYPLESDPLMHAK